MRNLHRSLLAAVALAAALLVSSSRAVRADEPPVTDAAADDAAAAPQPAGKADRALPHHPGGIEWALDLATARAASAADGRPVAAYFTFDT